MEYSRFKLDSTLSSTLWKDIPQHLSSVLWQSPPPKWYIINVDIWFDTVFCLILSFLFQCILFDTFFIWYIILFDTALCLILSYVWHCILCDTFFYLVLFFIWCCALYTVVFSTQQSIFRYVTLYRGCPIIQNKKSHKELLNLSGS